MFDIIKLQLHNIAKKLFATYSKVKQSQKIFKLETQVDDLVSQLASPKTLVRKIVNENSASDKEISADAFGEIFGLYQAKQRIHGDTWTVHEEQFFKNS